MIQYKVTGNIVKYKNADNIDIHSWQKIFKNDNPIIARQNAIKFYNNILAEIEEAGEKVEDKITTGGDAWDDMGLGIGVYLEIVDPFEKFWDKVDIPYEPTYPLGTELEEFIKEELGLDDEDDFEYYEEDYQWIILGVGKGIYATPPWFITGLENEIKIYDFFNYDKNGFETNASCFDHNDGKIKEHRILKIPYNWNSYNERQHYDKKIIQQEKADPEVVKYLDLIKNGEGKQVEFKATLNYCKKEKQKKDYIKLAIAKTIAAFLNTDGGLLFIGVNDNGDIGGLQDDYQTFESENKKDSFRRALNNIIRDFLGKECHQHIDAKFQAHNGLDFMVVTVDNATFPLTLKNNKEKEFYIRGVSDTEKLDIEETIKWVLEKFKKEK